ncbi:uncharacterized protein BO72DRAFT_496487 [Aspergillus fijiensis CBS 313.89]|uniref:Uncharacterized protein n=1 Tax=Aspergillus fijiensis CBS 313.89 TaxID=1448319 RepID=A0A8G1RTC9_9EURO|nr:uncharacterized protein BO72DRAFT_496487 [Aspergillus fijiensis CBS 313.89]RAK77156.1 hypothetical protein BO72DRAFT_496487 [Aspergillus fijiensis CBS 313.89]
MDPTLDPPLPPPPRRIHHRASPTRRRDHYQNNHNHHYRLTATATARSRCDDRSSQPSSDPAFFSSDDVPGSGGLENYTAGSAAGVGAAAATHTAHQPHQHASGAGGLAGTRKRRYRGTWWGEKMMSSGGHQPQGQEGAKRNKRVDWREKSGQEQISVVLVDLPLIFAEETSIVSSSRIPPVYVYSSL